MRMADADVLPYDYEEYGKEIAAYLEAAAEAGARISSANMRWTSDAVNAAAHHFRERGCEDPGEAEESAAGCSAPESGFARGRARAADAAGIAASLVVPACDLCAGRVYGLRGGGDSGSE